MKMDRRSFFAGAAALGAAAPLGGIADDMRGRPPYPEMQPCCRRYGDKFRHSTRHYDHVVVGGGFAGVAAALASARAGAKTCLLERTNVLGGLSTQGHVVVFMPLCDGFGRQVTFGIPEELLRLPMKYSAARPSPPWESKKGTKAELSKSRYELVFDPGPMMIGLERLLVDAGVDIFYDCEINSVTTQLGIKVPDCRLWSLQAAPQYGYDRLSFVAKAFTDATGSAIVARLCSAQIAEGREGNSPGGWYYAVDDERRITLRCGAGKTLKRLSPAEARDYRGDDFDDVSRHTIASRRAILMDIEEENKRRAANGQGLLHVFSIPTYATLLKLSRIAGYGDWGPTVGVFSDWRKKGPVYPLKYGQLVVPGVDNLLVAGRCIACADVMWDVVRCLPACCASGQAAGTAAALFAKGEADKDPQSSEQRSFMSFAAEALKKRLVADGVRLDDSLLVPDPEYTGGGEMREEGIF